MPSALNPPKAHHQPADTCAGKARQCSTKFVDRGRRSTQWTGTADDEHEGAVLMNGQHAHGHQQGNDGQHSRHGAEHRRGRQQNQQRAATNQHATDSQPLQKKAARRSRNQEHSTANAEGYARACFRDAEACY